MGGEPRLLRWACAGRIAYYHYSSDGDDGLTQPKLAPQYVRNGAGHMTHQQREKHSTQELPASRPLSAEVAAINGAEPEQRAPQPEPQAQLPARRGRDHAESIRTAEPEGALAHAARGTATMSAATATPAGSGAVTSSPLSPAHAGTTQQERNQLLRNAARRGRRESVVRLLQAKADPNATGAGGGSGSSGGASSGSSALHLACVTGDHDELVQVLLSMGADIEAPTADSGGMRPLGVACYYGRPRIVRALLTHTPPAELNATDTTGWTARDWAEHMTQEAVLEELPQEALCRRPASRLDELSPRWSG